MTQAQATMETKKDFDAAREALRNLETRAGYLDPDVVVEEARDPESDLHPYFEWDDTLAGQAYRLAQAGDLIRRVKIEIKTSDEQPMHCVRYVSTRRDAPSRYRTVTRAAIAPLLDMELRRLLGNTRRLVLICKGRPCDETAAVMPELESIEATLEGMLTT